MQNNLIHRVVLMSSFSISSIFFVFRILKGDDLLEAAYMSAYIMLAVSIVLMISIQQIVKILFEHLGERKCELQSDTRLNGEATFGGAPPSATMGPKIPSRGGSQL